MQGNNAFNNLNCQKKFINNKISKIQVLASAKNIL